MMSLIFVSSTGFGVMKKKSQDGFVNCQLIEKEFSNQAGHKTQQMEWYLRCSIQDYFIKLCESAIEERDLEPYLNKGISVKMEIREGEWDSCSKEDLLSQSRIGTYVIIKRIKN